MYSLADKYVVLANAYKNTVLQLTGVKDKVQKLVTINNPITIEAPNQIDLDAKKKEVLFVGRLTGQKGVDYLLDIWKIFSKQEKSWTLRIVGDGPMKPEMEARIKREQIPNVVFEGNQKNVARYYKQSPILCLTSRFEGWPLVIAEGLLYGNVVIAFNSFGAIHDIIDNGNNGFIIDAFDCKAYAQKLLLLAKDTVLRKSIAETAIKSADRFNMKNIVSQWKSIID